MVFLIILASCFSFIILVLVNWIGHSINMLEKKTKQNSINSTQIRLCCKGITIQLDVVCITKADEDHNADIVAGSYNSDYNSAVSTRIWSLVRAMDIGSISDC